ncbi:Chromosomal replication initiator protein DnaA domain-containing protein [Sphingomonas antarctica]|uniref:HdaA/DnaA family protein n=1 Tax=Sphingomonas antarctica TaxID=2040274 RepID=UPI0039E90A6E
MTQNALPFDWPAGEEDEGFVVSPSNAAAVRHLNSHARWPVAASVLTGPRKSGRSLLGRIFVLRTGGTLIENGERVDETELFHAWNAAQETRRPLLITADHWPTDWVITLPDLRSRLMATPHVTLADPDDQLIGQLLQRLLERRGIVLPEDVVSYLVPRVPRNHVAIVRLADALDTAALSERRALTVPFARQVLGRLWETKSA